MFLVDDVLLSPATGILFVLNQLAKRAREELLDDEAVRQDLRETYMLLEVGSISEQEFERREQKLIRRLEAIEKMKSE